MESDQETNAALNRVLAVSNQKGGVGKTTSAINLASYIARAGHNVLLVDIDPQGNATSGLGIDVHNLQKTIYDILLGEFSPLEVIQRTSKANLSVLPANVELSGIEVDLLEMEEREFILKRAIQQVKSQYDMVLIHCPPNLGILTLNALCASDGVLIPLQTEYYALEGLTQLMKVIRLVQSSLNPSLVLEGVVLTMYDKRTSLAQQVVEDVRAYFKDSVYESIIPRNVKLSEADRRLCSGVGGREGVRGIGAGGADRWLRRRNRGWGGGFRI